jgi:hypothetical protein
MRAWPRFVQFRVSLKTDALVSSGGEPVFMMPVRLPASRPRSVIAL